MELEASFAGNQAEVERSRQELQRQVMQLQATCAKLSDDAAATRELYALQLREAQQRLEQAEVGGGGGWCGSGVLLCAALGPLP